MAKKSQASQQESALMVPVVKESEQHVRHILDMPGLKVPVVTNRSECVGGLARAAALTTFKVVQRLAGRAWDDSASLVNFGDAAAERTGEVAVAVVEELQSGAAEVLSEVTDTAGRLVVASTEYALIAADKKVGQPVRKAREEGRDRHKQAVAKTRNSVNQYCDDAGTARIEELQRKIAGSPRSKLSKLMLEAASGE